MKLQRYFLDGYMAARTEAAKKMYARYLSYINPFLFEEKR